MLRHGQGHRKRCSHPALRKMAVLILCSMGTVFFVQSVAGVAPAIFSWIGVAMAAGSLILFLKGRR